MSDKRHVYRPPKGTFSGIFAILGGALATLMVFIAIPLSQKLADMSTPATVVVPEPEAPPPPELELLVEVEQEEILDDPPEPPPESAPDIDVGLDLGDLSVGQGGGLVINVPNFGVRDGEDPFGGGDLDTPPKPTSRFPPSYPSSALKNGRGGKVLVSCRISEKGSMASAKVRKSSGHQDLDQAALKAVQRWKFKPAIRAGKPIAATCVVPFNFEVKR